jgi:hypothetical protein
MFGRRPNRRKRNVDQRSRRLHIEVLEDRRMLAVPADVVFMVDTTGSAEISPVEEWLRLSLVPQLDATLRSPANGNPNDDIDVRYGLVRFGNFDVNEGFASSRIVDSNAADKLFSNGNHVTDFQDAISLLNFGNNFEDGWDAIEHAIAEYDFRDNAVPVFVLVQNDEGLTPANFTLTRDGILSALKSKNVILNTITVGQQDPVIANDWKPLFDLTPYQVATGDFTNRRILGVEADATDNVADGQHDYYLVNATNGSLVTTKPATESDALQVSFNGSNTGASGIVGTGKSILIGQNVSGGIGDSSLSGTDFNYRAKSVPFTRVDMTGAVTQTLNTAISFAFPFFGVSQSQLWVRQDGTITFTNTDPGANNADLSRAPVSPEPARPSGPTIAALWDDLAPASGGTGQVLKKSVDVDGDGTLDLVIQWTNFVYANGANPIDTDPITFQAVLYSGGRIQLNYVDLEADNNVLIIDESRGLSATVGIWKGSSETINLPAGKFVPGPHAIGGEPISPLSSSFSKTPDSYVRLAWDTGGAAWDVGIVDASINLPGGILSDPANALRGAFSGSLTSQILRAQAAGKVFHNEDAIQSPGAVMLALDIGRDAALPALNAGSAGIFRVDNGMFTVDAGTAAVEDFTVAPTQEIDIVSSSIPAVTTGVPTEDQKEIVRSIFRSARGEQSPDATLEDIHITIDALDNGSGGAVPLSPGSYFVELFFAELDDVETFGFGRVFDVRLEGRTMLNDYEPQMDFAKIDRQPTGEFRTLQSQFNTGVVKRYEVEVGVDGQAGLQIDLIHSPNATLDPILNGLRILRADAPRIENVVFKSSQWAKGVDYNYADAVGAGNQLRPIYLQGANRIEVHFDGPVNLDDAEMEIKGNNRATIMMSSGLMQTITLVPNPNPRIGIWDLNTPLGAGKYALRLGGVTGGGQFLDGSWTNFDGPNATTHSPDNFSGDKPQRLLSGNGNPGTIFEFHFSVLPGDSNQDGVVANELANNTYVDRLPLGLFDDSALATVADINGDGQRNNLDGLIIDNVLVSNSATTGSIGVGIDSLSLTKRRGDFAATDLTENDLVDADDYLVWRSTHGSTTDLRADANMNGTIDVADYIWWRDQLGVYSAWNLAQMGASSVFTFVDLGNAPRVANVTISGSQSTHAPFSFNGPDDNTDFDGLGIQLRTVPVGGADTVSITFSEDVNVEASHLTLLGLRTANRPVLAQFSYDILTMTATWRFIGWALGDQYVLSLSDAVTDIQGNALDGEWKNPRQLSTVNATVSEFPSGDGFAGGRFNFVMTLLPGDANLDGVVNTVDYAIFGANYGAQNALFTMGDFNGDGQVSYTGDGQILYANWNLNLSGPISILADLNGDLAVDTTDLTMLFNNFGLSNPTQAQGDLNKDGVIDSVDLDIAFAQFGLDLDVVG